MKRSSTATKEVIMPTYHVTTVEVETQVITYAVETECANDALNAVAKHSDLYPCVHSEFPEIKITRFKHVWDVETGDCDDISEAENKNLLGEDYRA
jgi:hypothetical protein